MTRNVSCKQYMAKCNSKIFFKINEVDMYTSGWLKASFVDAFSVAC